MENLAATVDVVPVPGRTISQPLGALFEPRSVAVIGASRTRGTIGAEILHNLISAGFGGPIYPVNLHVSTVEGLRAYPSVCAVPGPIDLAIVAVPAESVEAAVDDCIAKSVAAVVVISAGFGETGTEGRARENRLRDKLRATGARLVGPNCMGVVNTDPAKPLNATFSPVFPPAGPVAFSSQSGALGLAVLESAQRLNLGLSSFVSVGNKADVSTNDLLEYWEQDSRTSVILMYVESFGNPRRFAQIARRVGRDKPIVALKAGRSCSGARAASSHTGALAASDDVVDALFRDAGVIRTGTVEEMFETAALLAHQPLPAGPRVAVLTNAGGPGILAADACEAHGLTLGTLAPTTRDALRAFLPAAAGLSNPIDMIATASASDYRRAIPLLLQDPGIDSLLTIFIPPIVTRAHDVAAAIAETTRGAGKPVLATFFGASGVPDILAPVPCYTFPESAARALGHAVKYVQWRSAPAGQVPATQNFDQDSARRILARSRFTTDGWLEPLAVTAVPGILRYSRRSHTGRRRRAGSGGRGPTTRVPGRAQRRGSNPIAQERSACGLHRPEVGRGCASRLPRARAPAGRKECARAADGEGRGRDVRRSDAGSDVRAHCPVRQRRNDGGAAA